MCTSRLHRVVASDGPGAVLVDDLDGRRHRVSLLALDPPEPTTGEWLVVHSGYAIGRVDADEAASVVAEIRSSGISRSNREEPGT
jgi:hydrogenase expression/formation protein HypC